MKCGGLMNGGAPKEPEYSLMIKYHTLRGSDTKFLEPAMEKRGLFREISLSLRNGDRLKWGTKNRRGYEGEVLKLNHAKEILPERHK